jgi:hypothetical protein
MGCGCKNAEGGCGCGTKEMNWESYDKPSFKKTMMAESWGGTDQDTMEEFFGYDLDTSPDQRVAEMLTDTQRSLDLPSLVWYFQNSLNGQGDWMTANYGKDSVEEALARVQGRMGIPNKFGFSAEEPACGECGSSEYSDDLFITKEGIFCDDCITPGQRDAWHRENASYNPDSYSEKGDIRKVGILTQKNP